MDWNTRSDRGFSLLHPSVVLHHLSLKAHFCFPFLSCLLKHLWTITTSSNGNCVYWNEAHYVCLESAGCLSSIPTLCLISVPVRRPGGHNVLSEVTAPSPASVVTNLHAWVKCIQLHHFKCLEWNVLPGEILFNLGLDCGLLGFGYFILGLHERGQPNDVKFILRNLLNQIITMSTLIYHLGVFLFSWNPTLAANGHSIDSNVAKSFVILIDVLRCLSLWPVHELYLILRLQSNF